MMTFKEKLVVLRKIKHLTQDEFASAVGVSRQAVYKWESGQSYPEVQKLLEMKLLFGISIDDLLDDTYEIELPKKKRRKRTPKVAQENAEATAEVKAEAPAKVEEPKAEVKAEAPAKVEAPKAEVKAEAPAKVEAPKAEVKVEAPAKVETPKAEVKVEAPAKVEAPKAEVEVEEPAKVEAPKAEVEAEEPKKEFKIDTSKVERVEIPVKEIVDPTDKFAKRGGLFAKIFGNKK